MSAFLLGVPGQRHHGLAAISSTTCGISHARAIPILVDADTGFGNAVNVRHTVGEVIRSGVPGTADRRSGSAEKVGHAGSRRCSAR